MVIIIISHKIKHYQFAQILQKHIAIAKLSKKLTIVQFISLNFVRHKTK